MKIPMSMRRRWLTTTLAVAALGGFFALIVASPWLIGSIVGHSEDWRRLSDVGQAYGGISAILSGLAFCGIAGSLLLQWRQVRQAQMAAVHERHFELVRLAIEDTDLRAPGPAAPAGAEAKQWVYFNLWVAHWAMRWDIRALGRQEARKQLATLFYDDAASRWWLACGPLWSINADERR